MPRLIQGSVKLTMFRMAFPMLAGTIAMNAYNLADTWYVARLGTLPLAAMGFTFPIVMLLTFIAGGIGSGVTTLTSHALGRSDQKCASQTVTHGMALMVLVAGLMSVAGYFSINWVFTLLGADAQTLPLIGQYMGTWYLGAVFMVLPMMGNGILISCGDSKAASRFILLGAVLNVILDPIMIFGWLGFPALGIFGAALATVISQAVSTIWLFYLLSIKHRLLSFERGTLTGLLTTWRSILGFAIPGSISMMLMPVSSAVITGLVSSYGNEAVAACGAAVRIESFAFVVPMALGMSMTPFVSQNFGAGRLDRIREAQSLSTRFALIYGGFIAIAFVLATPLFTWVFTSDPKVAEILASYIRIISFGYGMMEVHRYSGFFLTGMHRPIAATGLNAVRVVVLLLPLSYAGMYFFGIRGIFAGRLVTDLIVGTLGLIFIRRVLASTRLQAPALSTSSLR